MATNVDNKMQKPLLLQQHMLTFEKASLQYMKNMFTNSMKMTKIVQ